MENIEKNFSEALRLSKKIKENSFLPVHTSNVFYFYDPEMAKKITEEGKKQMEKIKSHFEKLGFKVEIEDD